MRQSIKLVSVGRHTRLGDILERAVEGFAFETVRAEDVPGKDMEKQKLLFAVSGDNHGGNEALSTLTRAILSGECRLNGSVCAVVGDDEQGGALHADILKLLLALNGAGGALVNRPCVEASRDLKNLPYQTGDESAPPFEQYRRQARLLTERLMEFEPAKNSEKRIRPVFALAEEGTVRDWQSALEREASARGGTIAPEGETAYTTLFVCENLRNIPDETTLRMLDGLGACTLSCIAASPRFGADFFCMQILERACLQGAASLAPRAFTICDGASAAEALAVGPIFEKVRHAIANLL